MVLVRIFAPIENEDGIWRCCYEISENGNVIIDDKVTGNDSLQPLVLALYKIETQLRHSGKLNDYHLEEEMDGGYGFLTSRNAWKVHDP